MDLDKRSAGVLLHTTSLPSPHGIGDFGPAAFQFVDWLVAAGQSVWQLLPTAPVGPGNSPYQSVSAFAGSPLMVALEPLVARGWLSEPVLPEGGFDPRRVDYGKVIPWRLEQLRAAAKGFAADADDAERVAFATWRTKQASWLDDYALFMALETSSNYQTWWQWEDALRRRQTAALAAARVRHADEIAFWQFVQWQFDAQLASVKQYANERGVFLMGDLPIFVAHHSADVWARPDLYTLDEEFQPTVVAGCPPDAMAIDGQRWGNPLYHWDRMATEDFAWWTARVRRALEQADVFRIDHFRGFAGYYEIPASCPTAREGTWRTGPGRPLFDAIARALGPLPIVAEDLGFITPDVYALRDGLGYPGMRILQFAFSDDAGNEFLPHHYVRNTIAYTGTHDNDTARGWWDNANPHERAFAGSYLASGGEGIHWAMIRACCNSVANIAVSQLQDILGLDSAHRMNTPGSVGDQNWSWRFEWSMLDGEAGRVLALVSAASGRAPIGLARLP